MRSGLLIGGTNSIEKKFFVHNIGSVFDFALAVDKIDPSLVSDLVEKQVRSAESLRQVDGMTHVKKFAETVELQ